MQKQRLFVSTMFLASLGAACAKAATITPVSRALIEAAVAGGVVSGQNFDSIASGTVLGTLGGVTFGASEGSPAVTGGFLTTTAPNGLGSTSQSLLYFGPNESASFFFANPITAFAIDVNTYAPTEGDFTATLGSGLVAASTLNGVPSSSAAQFIGFVSDTPFDSVTIRAVFDSVGGGAYSYTLDSLAYGSGLAVTGTPEPSTLALLGVGLAWFWWRMRRGLSTC